jgi:hypothetical protein
LRTILIVLGGIAFLSALVVAWNWYQDVQHSLREQDTSLRAVRPGPGTPTPAGARLPTAFPIAAASPSPTATATPEPVPTPSPVIEGILVEFRTTARVYVEAAVDSKQVLAETLPPGTERKLPLANDSVILRASNGSALEISVNGTRQEPVTERDPVEFTWQR